MAIPAIYAKVQELELKINSLSPETSPNTDSLSERLSVIEQCSNDMKQFNFEEVVSKVGQLENQVKSMEVFVAKLNQIENTMKTFESLATKVNAVEAQINSLESAKLQLINDRLAKVEATLATPPPK